ncbi:MAG: response regulator transcription factor [Nitrospinae bacterium]|nr:response regulator transcription factor [Nitrospinota bacterium]
MTPSILIVDDDKDLLELLKLKLGKEDFKVHVAYDGKSGIDAVKNKAPDLVILDVNMPRMNGLDVCKILRSEPKTKNLPIIMLTAKNEEIDRVLGLEFGADDYISKPFSVRELVLRIKNILKRSRPPEEKPASLHYGILTVDMDNHEVKVKNKLVSLTLTEFKLLAMLLERPGQVKSRDFLLEEIWEYGDGVYSRTVDTHVQRLRSKLKEAGKYIETVRGIGYRLQEN